MSTKVNQRATCALVALLVIHAGAATRAAAAPSHDRHVAPVITLARACEVAKVVAVAVTGAPEEDGSYLVSVERVLEPSRLGDVGPVVFPDGTDLDASSRFLLLLSIGPESGALQPIDPTHGIIPLDGRMGRADHLIAAVELELSPPADERRVAAYLGQLDQGDFLAASAARTLASRSDWLDLVPMEAGTRLLDSLSRGAHGPAAAAEIVSLVAETGPPHAASALVELVARGAPPNVVERVAAALSRLDAPLLEDDLLHAMSRAPRRSVPGLLSLLGRTSGLELLPEVHQHATSSDPAHRLAAIDAMGRIGSSRSVPVLQRLLGHHDPSTREAASRALASLRGGDRPGR